jgi:hypothetical protein
MEDALASDPRIAAGDIYKKRLAGALFDSGHYDEVADFTLLCIQKQPGQLDRVYYALTLRAKALSKLGKHEEALAAAKSLYNWCLVKDTPKAIDIIADCLTAAYPNDPGKAKRFKLQQLAGGSDQPSTLDLGPSIFAEIKVDPKVYESDALTREKGEWKRFVQASVLLLQDQPAKAREIFEPLRKSTNPKVSTESTDAVGRCIKAEQGRLAEANAFVKSVQPAPPAP